MPTTTSSISFVLDGRNVSIDFEASPHRPTQTLLWYLRSLPNHKDVKEGCAEGDCGACTVVLGELNAQGNIQYKAVDSCLILLPQIDGKWVLTPNSIGTPDAMHSVQQAMVDTDGSQCGYCTPGFIMSLFALQQNHQEPSRAVIDDALTGNLCRCTGYQSIVKAAEQTCAGHARPKLPEADQAASLLAEHPRHSVAIATAEQHYFKPSSLREALRLKADHHEARLVQGATDVGLLVTKQKQVLPAVIDLSAVAELRTVQRTDDSVIFGSGTSLETVKAESQQDFPALYKMLAVFGSLQIRNLATLGGNLGSASPIGDTPPVLMAYDAIIHMESVDGKRAVPAQEFITGYRQTVLQPNELITAVEIPLGSNALVHSYKISKRKDLDISTVSAGFRLELNGQNVQRVCLFYGGMAAQTLQAASAEAFLTGKPWTRETIEAALPLIDNDFTPISDARSGAEARKIMARNLLLKFWIDTTNA